MNTTPEQHQSTIKGFRKASYSNQAHNCVEVADCTCHSSIRDTQNRHLGALDFGRSEWSGFLALVRK